MKYIRTWAGWGDSLYQRPVLKEFLKRDPDIIVETPLPQLFHDLPLRFAKHPTTLRTQSQNVKLLDASGFTWDEPPAFPPIQMCHFKRDFDEGLTVFGALERSAGVQVSECVMDFPLKEQWEVVAEAWTKHWGEFAIVKPNTIRQEWRNPARNCKEGLIEVCVDECKQQGITTVCFANLDRSETTEGALPVCDFEYLDGRIDMFTLMALASKAKVTIGSVGNILPIAMSTGALTFVIGGGYQDPRQLIDDRFDHSMLEFVLPKNPCSCFNHNHECRKSIDPETVRESFRSFLNVGRG